MRTPGGPRAVAPIGACRVRFVARFLPTSPILHPMVDRERLTPAQCNDVWDDLAPDDRTVLKTRRLAASVPTGLVRTLKGASLRVLPPGESVLQVKSDGGPAYDGLVPEFIDWIEEFGHTDD